MKHRRPSYKPTRRELEGNADYFAWASRTGVRADRPEDAPEPRPRRRSSRPEQQIQRAVLDYLAHAPAVAWAHKFASGMFRVPDSSPRGYRMVQVGFPGCSDILGQMKDGRFLAIEVKTGRGKATDAQQRFLDLVAAHGGVSGVARSVDEARALVEGK